MAMRAYILGQKAVIKESGGRFFLSKAVPWTDNKELAPKEVKDKWDDFTRAVKGCKVKSKYKGGTVWGVSEFNKCIGERLKKSETKGRKRK